MITSQELIIHSQQYLSTPEKSTQFLINAGMIDKHTGELVIELKEE
jgi:hypothetical protein